MEGEQGTSKELWGFVSKQFMAEVCADWGLGWSLRGGASNGTPMWVGFVATRTASRFRFSGLSVCKIWTRLVQNFGFQHSYCASRMASRFKLLTEVCADSGPSWCHNGGACNGTPMWVGFIAFDSYILQPEWQIDSGLWLKCVQNSDEAGAATPLGVGCFGF